MRRLWGLNLLGHGRALDSIKRAGKLAEAFNREVTKFDQDF